MLVLRTPNAPEDRLDRELEIEWRYQPIVKGITVQ
jgi:hypothetical protein